MGLLRYSDNRIINDYSLGEMVYPTVLGRNGKLNMFEFFQTMNNINTIYVILYASNENTLFLNSKQDGDANGLTNPEIKLSNLFYKQSTKMFKNNDKVLTFDVSKTNSEEIINIIKIVEKQGL